MRAAAVDRRNERQLLGPDRDQHLLGVVFATTIALEAAAPATLADKAALLIAVGVVLAAVGTFSRRDPREALAMWVGTVFGAVYVGQIGLVARLGLAAPELAARTA